MTYFGWVLLRGRDWTELDGTLVQLPRLWARVGPAHTDRDTAIAWAQRFRRSSVAVCRTRLLSTSWRPPAAATDVLVVGDLTFTAVELRA